jgi:hypothetical protein
MGMNLRKISRQKELTGNNPQQILFAEGVPAVKSLYRPGSKREKLEDKFENLIDEELKLGSVVSYVGNKIVVIYSSLCHYEEFSAIEYAILRELIENKGFEVDFVEHGSTIKRNECVLKTIKGLKMKLTELLHP